MVGAAIQSARHKSGCRRGQSAQRDRTGSAEGDVRTGIRGRPFNARRVNKHHAIVVVARRQRASADDRRRDVGHVGRIAVELRTRNRSVVDKRRDRGRQFGNQLVRFLAVGLAAIDLFREKTGRDRRQAVESHLSVRAAQRDIRCGQRRPALEAAPVDEHDLVIVAAGRQRAARLGQGSHQLRRRTAGIQRAAAGSALDRQVFRQHVNDIGVVESASHGQPAHFAAGRSHDAHKQSVGRIVRELVAVDIGTDPPVVGCELAPLLELWA